MERTGIAHIDELIESYIALDPEFIDEDLQHPQNPRWQPYSLGRLSDMRLDPNRTRQRSTALCGRMTDHFVEFLISRGQRAYASDQQGENTWAWHGYADRTLQGNAYDDSHCAALIDIGDRTYMIGFAASQYGYGEWPMVQRAGRYDGHAAPVWEREWDLALAGREGAIMYHVCDADQLDQIARMGLIGAQIPQSGTAINPPGNYMFQDMQDCDLYAQALHASWGIECEVVQVDTHGLNLRRDEIWTREDKDAEYGAAWLCEADIEPHRLSGPSIERARRPVLSDPGVDTLSEQAQQTLDGPAL
jgi:hypothetical protein